MFIVGLTGGIASGKSLVARVFKDLGATVIDADRIVHELLEPDQDAWREIIQYFGQEVQRPDKTIDRRKLGAIVFNDREKRTWLNACLHPRVFSVYTTRAAHIRMRTPDALLFFDAALLIESGYHRNVDRLIVVYAEPEQQVERLMARDGFTSEEALLRIASQMPLSEKRLLADHVIDNSGSREQTEQQARELFGQLNRESKGRA
ncbi:MAG: dephospho-CoA kinase [Nitrospirae bacterium GWC2_56_14]|nr:MAG: dephospho-CoA kinase [Nitrospirae bacterium GWC2_56_14]